jgi:hypothetical protein
MLNMEYKEWNISESGSGFQANLQADDGQHFCKGPCDTVVQKVTAAFSLL